MWTGLLYTWSVTIIHVFSAAVVLGVVGFAALIFAMRAASLLLHQFLWMRKMWRFQWWRKLLGGHWLFIDGSWQPFEWKQAAVSGSVHSPAAAMWYARVYDGYLISANRMLFVKQEQWS